MKFRIVIHASGTIIDVKDEHEAIEIGGDLAMQALRVEKVSEDIPINKEGL